jgi:hypothetical protein
MTLVANGGRGPYIWKDAGSSCPQGLAFDPGTQTLSGCVTDAAVSQNVFVLKVMVSSDQSAIMNSLTVTLPISVVEPAQVAKEATDYTAFALACAGTTFLAITAAKNIYEWIKAKEKNAGDPAYKNNYVMAKELATSLKSGIEGVVGKNFVHYIETALQFDIKYPNRLLDLQGLKLSALELYESHIDIYNRRIATVIKKIADEKAGKNDAKKLNKLDADLDKLKVDFMNDLNSTHILIGDELIARKREEEAEATKSFKEKLRGCI